MKKLYGTLVWIISLSLMVLHSTLLIYHEPTASSYYYHSNTYLIAMLLLTSIVLVYVLWYMKKILYRVIALICTLFLYSILTMSIYGSSIHTNHYENVFFPFLSFNYTKTYSNADFELSDCKVNYFFYDVKNKHNHTLLWRGISSIDLPSLCDRNINSPSYTKDSLRVEMED